MDQNLINAFVDEAKDSLKDLEANLIRIEGPLESLDSLLINTIFRKVHSIKGGAGFIGLTRIKDLAHAIEKVLDRIRRHETTPSGNVVSILLRARDALAAMINDPEKSSGLDIQGHIEELEGALSSSEAVEGSSDGINAKLPDGRAIFTLSRSELESIRADELFVYLLEYDLVRDISDKGLTVDQFIRSVETQGMSVLKSSDSAEAEGADNAGRTSLYLLAANPLEPSLLSMILERPLSWLHVVFDPDKDRESGRKDVPAHFAGDVNYPSARPVPPEPPLSAPSAEDKARAADENAPPPAVIPSSLGENTIRVNLSSLDTLMTLAGELVLTRNQLQESIRTWNRKGISDSFQRLNIITSGVQESVMSTRMQPVDTLFAKFYRLVRDIATRLGKRVELVVEGKEVELDKAVIEAITDPLVHMLRNSIDHGIEPPETRVREGKPPHGTIMLRASHQAGQVKLVISDDGAGIDVEKVKQKALLSGKLAPHQIYEMSEKQLVRLIFVPGITTVDSANEISGMGVGMDVVQSNLSRIGGVIDIHTELGRGTSFEIKLPLTLAIIPGLLVTSADLFFVIPQVNVSELVRVHVDKAREVIQKIGSAVVFRLRGELLPLITLQEALGPGPPLGRDLLPEDGHSPALKAAKAGKRRAVNIAVVNAGDMQYGIVVDSFMESEDIVVKPLGRHLKDCGIYSGATILGNGTVALILDVNGICELMNLAMIREIAGQKMAASVKVDSRPVSHFLVVSSSSGQQYAFPLECVVRIERVSKSSIELTAGRPSIRYRERSLPLFALEEAAPPGPGDDADLLYIIIVMAKGHPKCFMASRIEDIVETSEPIDQVTFRSHGICGSLHLLQRTTLIINVESDGTPTIAGRDGAETGSGEIVHRASVLVVEDSEFFLGQFDTLLRSAGYKTYLARDGNEALEILESRKVDLLLTDIEMPNMDGFELTAEVRRRPSLSAMPVFAMTSMAGESHQKRGREAGINEYLVKFDSQELLQKLDMWLPMKEIRTGGS